MPYTAHGWNYPLAPQEWPRAQARCTGTLCGDCSAEKLLIDTTISILAGEDPQEVLADMPSSEQARTIAKAIERAPQLAESITAQLQEWQNEQRAKEQV